MTDGRSYIGCGASEQLPEHALRAQGCRLPCEVPLVERQD